MEVGVNYWGGCFVSSIACGLVSGRREGDESHGRIRDLMSLPKDLSFLEGDEEIGWVSRMRQVPLIVD